MSNTGKPTSSAFEYYSGLYDKLIYILTDRGCMGDYCQPSLNHYLNDTSLYFLLCLHIKFPDQNWLRNLERITGDKIEVIPKYIEKPHITEGILNRTLLCMMQWIDTNLESKMLLLNYVDAVNNQEQSLNLRRIEEEMDGTCEPKPHSFALDFLDYTLCKSPHNFRELIHADFVIRMLIDGTATYLDC